MARLYRGYKMSNLKRKSENDGSSTPFKKSAIQAVCSPLVVSALAGPESQEDSQHTDLQVQPELQDNLDVKSIPAATRSQIPPPHPVFQLDHEHMPSCTQRIKNLEDKLEEQTDQLSMMMKDNLDATRHERDALKVQLRLTQKEKKTMVSECDTAQKAMRQLTQELRESEHTAHHLQQQVDEYRTFFQLAARLALDIPPSTRYRASS
ncbi:hypothetical protein D9758_013737 [Tetrapyrgos nigripes]|uniref:Uncharacterized protein n=1 Tax=Tetrapyrgos nigripes TaxID=182062 RepID=A0A8H5G1Q0_9AGAR|nr:hypothetical protein D9758_013737 [Tetrapyrgos nigripes]